jgi:hypothetical protein
MSGLDRHNLLLVKVWLTNQTSASELLANIAREMPVEDFNGCDEFLD